MSRSPRDSQTVTLFPFLAVLVCAMGSLLVLLIITTQKIRSDAIARVRIEMQQQRAKSKGSLQVNTRPEDKPVVAPRPAPAPLPAIAPYDPNVALREEIARLRANSERARQERAATVMQAEAARKELESARTHLAGLERVIQESKQLEIEDAKLRSEIEAAHSDVDSKAAELRRRMKLLREQQVSASSRYAFIPYDGQSGTTRRPIFIECREDGIRFLPEDVVVTPRDLEDFRASYNPLLAGTEALLKYWSAKRRESPEKDNGQEPYLLFLVRPNGSVAYYVARHMLSRMPQQTGYELINDEMELAFPKADPDAKIILQRAIADALKRRPSDTEAVAAPTENTRGFHFQRGEGGGFLFDESEGVSGGGGGVSGGAESGRGGSVAATDRTGQSTNHPSGANRSSQSSSQSGTLLNPSASRGGSGRGWGEQSANTGDRHGAPSGKGGGAIADSRSVPSSESESPGEDDERLMLRPATIDGAQPTNPERGGPDIVYIGKQKPTGASGGSEDKWSKESKSPGGSSETSSGSGANQTARPQSSTGVFDQSYGESPKNSRSGSQPVKRRWGVSGANATIGLERQVNVEVFENRIIVGGDVVIRVGGGETRKELSEAFLSGVDIYIRTWGSPPPDFYWVPSVKFSVGQGGNQHSARLDGVLRELGIRTSIDSKSAAPASASTTGR